MTLEILAKSKGGLYFFLSKILSEPKASELFCAGQSPQLFALKNFSGRTNQTFLTFSVNSPLGRTPMFT